MNSDRVIVLIMAAGYSRRFGSDKRSALLPNGKRLLASTVAQAQQIFTQAYVVLKEGERPEALGLCLDTQCIRIKKVSAGLGDSLACAFDKLVSDASFAKFHGALIWLGDMPWIKPATCHQILAAADRNLIVRPHHAGKPGHPIFFGRSFWSELANLEELDGGRTVIAKNKSHCVLIDVADQNINIDIDLPTDIDSSNKWL